ncbi:MAG: HlyC/CorC family transporter [Verrucomicrobiales bacterium]|nr:HlyC/CorC family transporter [Verrucomicrobiales bacterium]MCP5525990.1 HlyC/CorC family transporter [Verrucomicrobiales bacterium]
MGAWPIWVAVAVLVFAGTSFFCALAETALFTLSHWQLRQMGTAESEAGKRVQRLLETPQDLLATLALWNMVAHAGLVLVAARLILVRDWPAVPTLAGAFVLTLMGGEVVPKTLAVRAPDFWARRVGWSLGWLMRLSLPVRQLAQQTTGRILKTVLQGRPKPGDTSDAEYAELLDLAYQQGALGEAGRDIILKIVTLDQCMARDVMRPRAQMIVLEDETPVPEMLTAARRLGHSRIPLYDESPDTIVGILNTRKLLLNPEADLSEAVEFPSFVPDSINLLRLLKSLQKQRRGMAIVLDEYGSAAGLVTTEDILGALIGRRGGPGREPGAVLERRDEQTWEVSGVVRVDDFRRHCPELGEVEEVDTLGGLLVSLAGVVPARGASVTFGNLRLKALDVDQRRVRRLEVKVLNRKGAARR